MKVKNNMTLKLQIFHQILIFILI